MQVKQQQVREGGSGRGEEDDQEEWGRRSRKRGGEGSGRVGQEEQEMEAVEGCRGRAYFSYPTTHGKLICCEAHCTVNTFKYLGTSL